MVDNYEYRRVSEATHAYAEYTREINQAKSKSKPNTPGLDDFIKVNGENYKISRLVKELNKNSTIAKSFARVVSNEVKNLIQSRQTSYAEGEDLFYIYIKAIYKLTHPHIFLVPARYEIIGENLLRFSK